MSSVRSLVAWKPLLLFTVRLLFWEEWPGRRKHPFETGQPPLLQCSGWEVGKLKWGMDKALASLIFSFSHRMVLFQGIFQYLVCAFMQRLLPHYRCIFKAAGHIEILLYFLVGESGFLWLRLFLCGIKRYLWIEFGLYRRLISLSSSRSSIQIVEESKSLAEGASSLCSVAKNNDMEADVPPTSKSRIAMCTFYIVYKFVSEICSLTILHCWGEKKKVCIEEEHKREGGNGLQLWAIAQEASPCMLLPQDLCCVWCILPGTGVGILGASTVVCSGGKAHGWFLAVSEMDSSQSP